ncbi:MAG: cation diffusion facilitator family transporter [Gallionella sp.]|nr:cation diffusion facilitator family transporter [Gallionella sp.]
MNMSHDHDHRHVAAGATLLWAMLLTLGFAAVEAGVGLWAGSLALVADAGHMVNDAAALLLAAVAAWLAQRPPSPRHSYGLGRAEFIAALINSVGLLALVVWLVVTAVERLQTPQAVMGEAVSVTAAIGLAINLLVAWLLARGEKNLNTRAAFLHVMGDLLGSVAALLSGLVITHTGWMPIDPILSLVIGALILVSSLRLLREVLHGLMEGAPFSIDPETVGKELAAVPGVASVHDLHIWAVKSDEPLLTAHLVVEDMAHWEQVMTASHALLLARFHIHHATLQPEPMMRSVQWRARPDA